MERRASRDVHVGLWIAIAGLILFVSLLTLRVFLPSRMLEVVDPRAVPVSFDLGTARALFLTESGTLRLAVERKNVLNIFSWNEEDISTVSTQEVVNFPALTGRQVKFLLHPFVSSEQSGLSNDLLAAGGLAYAFSDDGDMICWAWNGILYVGPISAPKQYREILEDSSPVIAVSFLGSRFVVAIHGDGNVKLFDLSGQVPSDKLGGIPVKKGRWRISGRGRYRVFSHFDQREGFLMDSMALGKPFEKFYWGFPSTRTGLFVTNSPDGEIFLGTSEGLVWALRSSSPRRAYDQLRAISVPGIRRIQVIAAYDSRYTVVGGNSSGLAIVKDGSRAVKMADAARDIRLLAVNSRRISYATEGSLVAARLEKTFHFDDPVKFWFAVSFSVLSLVAFIRLIAIDLVKIYWRG